MISKKNLDKYIKECSTVIANRDISAAALLQDEIISVFGDYIKNLTEGLFNYSTLDMLSFDGCHISIDIDFIGNIKKLKNKLLFELDKIEDVQENSKHFSNMQNKIFISHSPIDENYAVILIDFLMTLGINEKDIFTSSVPGYSVPISENRYDYIANKFRSNNMFVLFLLSANYYDSVMCANEMGALWVLKSDYASILLPGFVCANLDGAIDPRKTAIEFGGNEEKINSRLNELQRLLFERFKLNEISYTRWEHVRNSFVSEFSKKETKKQESLEDILNRLIQLGTQFNEKNIVKMGYSDSEADEIIHQLLGKNYIKKARFGLYECKK